MSIDADPTAICCMNDGVAIDLMDSLERRGRRVPQDVSICGFDDVPLAETWEAINRALLASARQW